MKFLGKETSLNSFIKAYKATDAKRFFPYEWFDNPDKFDFPKLPPCEIFFKKLKNNNPLEKTSSIMRSGERVGLTNSKH